MKFSRAIRRHMRDPAWFALERLWTAEMNDAAESLLACVRAAPTLAGDDVVPATLRQRRGEPPGGGPRVGDSLEGSSVLKGNAQPPPPTKN